MIVTTTPTVEGYRITGYYGIVFGEVITGINFLKDFGAGIRNLVGGRSAGYEEELMVARTQALEELQQRAAALGAHAIVGVDMDYEVLGQGNMLMVTASGTGAEMNGGAVITNEDAKIKGGMFSAAPRFAILDPDYTMSLPRMQVLSGAFDTLSHAMETYFGRSDRDNVSDEVALAVMRSTVVNMRALLKDLNDYTARSNLMWTSAMAENGILKVGRVTDFECHQMEHQLGAYTDCNHGQGLAVLHPAYYRHIVKDAPEKFARLGQVVFGVEGAEAAVDALAAFIQECGLPTRLSQLRSKVEITPELLRQGWHGANMSGGIL